MQKIDLSSYDNSVRLFINDIFKPGTNYYGLIRIEQSYNLPHNFRIDDSRVRIVESTDEIKILQNEIGIYEVLLVTEDNYTNLLCVIKYDYIKIFYSFLAEPRIVVKYSTNKQSLFYSEKGFLVDNSYLSCAIYHAKMYPDGEYKFRIHDCNNAIRLRGNIIKDPNGLQEAKDKFRKLREAIESFEKYLDSLEQFECSYDSGIPGGDITVTQEFGISESRPAHVLNPNEYQSDPTRGQD